jgi:peptidoglycan/xylan/chitin deacetylase (PgdA/CDA1 family)
MHTSHLLFFITILANVNAFYTYADTKENCSMRATGTFCYNGPKFDRYGQYKSCVVPGVLAITFDDGPTTYTSHILDVLKKYNMKATFNIKATQIHSFRTVVQRIADEGHQIASHTYSHSWLTRSPDVAKDMYDFEKSLLIEQFTGVLSGKIPSYMRAPHGSVNNTVMAILHQLGYVPIHWTFLTDDTTSTPPDPLEVYYAHLGGQNGNNVDVNGLSIITQQHDSVAVTSNNFERVIDYLNHTFGARGLKFVTVAECLGNNPPAMRPYTRLDPDCIYGVKNNNICCMASCGTCGGSHCGSLSGGAEGCCITNIQTANNSCDSYPAPCVISDTPLQNDPNCIHGIKAGNICCASSCGICGGNGCSLRVGGANGCCSGSILLANLSCNTYTSPCIISPTPTPTPTPSDPLCAEGIKANNICCLSSCGTCGGTGCSTRVGGADGCCGGDIFKTNISCNTSPAPCIIG